MPLDSRNRVVPDLKRFLAFERELVVLEAAAVRLAPRLHDKYALARAVHQDSQHALRLHERIRQLRDEPPKEAPLPPALGQALRLPVETGGAALLEGLFGVLKRAQVARYIDYVEHSDQIGDSPTVELLRDFLAQDQEQLDWARQAAREQFSPEELAGAAAPIEAALAAAGGVDGHAEQAAQPNGTAASDWYFPPQPAWADQPLRFDYGGDGPADDLYPHCWGIHPRLSAAGVAWWLFNESDALDYFPPFFWDTRWAPVQFHADLGRHLWDEARHSHGGYRALGRLGLDPGQVEHPLQNAYTMRGLPPWAGYTIVTQLFEAGSFKPKAEIIAEVDRLGDAELSDFLRYDRADETMHVSLGVKWIPTLAGHEGLDLPLGELAERAADLLRARQAELAASPPLGRGLPPGERLSLIGLAERWNIPLPAGAAV